jgi:hypothetical protein
MASKNFQRHTVTTVVLFEVMAQHWQIFRLGEVLQCATRGSVAAGHVILAGPALFTVVACAAHTRIDTPILRHSWPRHVPVRRTWPPLQSPPIAPGR